MHKAVKCSITADRDSAESCSAAFDAVGCTLRRQFVHTKTGFPGPVRDCSGIGELLNRAGLEHYVSLLNIHCASKTHCIEEAGPCQQTHAQSGCQPSLSKNGVTQSDSDT